MVNSFLPLIVTYEEANTLQSENFRLESVKLFTKPICYWLTFFLDLDVFEKKNICKQMNSHVFLFRKTRSFFLFFSYPWVIGLCDVTINEIFKQTDTVRSNRLLIKRKKDVL